jgi:hypothetical protein
MEATPELQDGKLSYCSTSTNVILITFLFMPLWASSPTISKEFLLVYGTERVNEFETGSVRV